VRYEIDETQATVVRQIFAWYAEGYSYKWIASELNRRTIPSSRGSTWAVSAVKVILDNERYEGKAAWNRRIWVKHPDTGRRTYRKRPQIEWIVREMPELRIVSHEVVELVRHRQRRNRQDGRGTSASAQRYLFSGLLTCAACGGNMVIVTPGRYGCATHKTRGPTLCATSGTVSRRIVEHHLLHSIKERLMEPTSVETFTRAVTRLMEARSAAATLDELKRQRHEAERIQRNILDAIRQGIVTTGTKQALESAEADVVRLSNQIDESTKWNVAELVPRLVERYREAIAELEERLSGHVEPAREILGSLLGDRVRLHRQGDHFVAELADGVSGLVVKWLNLQHDLSGCGGPMCTESYFVPLTPAESGSQRAKTASESADSVTKQSDAAALHQPLPESGRRRRRVPESL
jgi:site-specific DNA recombinase